MTNKPMLSVACNFCGCRNEIPAAGWGCVTRVEGQCFVCKQKIVYVSPAEPAAQHQDSNPGWPDPLEGTLAKEIINNPAAFDLAIRDLFDKLCREIQAGRYYRRFSGSEPMEFTANQGEPVEYWYVGDIDGYGCLYTAPDKDGIKLCAEQSTPITADNSALLGLVQSNISIDGRGFYHLSGIHPDNFKRALDASGAKLTSEVKPHKSLVAVVMPERMDAAPFTTIDRGSKNYKAGYNAALTEVARLNGVKP